MKKILFTVLLAGVTLFSFSQIDPNLCSTQLFGGGFESVDASWESVSNSNSYTSYLNTGVDCPVNVGIGTSTPRAELDVAGTTYTSSLAIGSINPVDVVGKFYMKIPVGGNYALQYDVFRIENADRQILNVDHTGLLRAREIIVDAQTWPDYVFRNDYNLMPLKEVEDYIEENGHLPNVPSQEEVLEDGQSLGEMNIILLEKVEELTLHLIEQQKQIEELKDQIQKQ